MSGDCYCGECKQPTEAVVVDFGIGPYEHFGHCGVHKDERLVSRCCEADCFEDEECKFEYTECEHED